jgi:predicted acyltransferase
VTDAQQLPAVKGRVESIDALRGFDMFWITGGGTIFASLDKIFDHPVTAFIHKQLQHVEWEGFQFEDLIMPLFLFIVGVVMPYSFTKRLKRGDGKAKLYLHIVTRVIILFILGMVAQGRLLELDLSRLHIFCNTLQAIAAGYLISAIIILNMRTLWQVIVTAGLLILFWLLMVLVPAPGYGAGDLSPEGNLAIYIDKLILGPFQDETTYTWILSSMTFATTVMMGVFAGQWLRTEKSGLRKVAGLLIAGIVCIIAGCVWGIVFPIIKHLWTSSFVLFSGGISLLLLAVFYLVIDVWGFKKWAFGFKVIGMNAIFVYMAVHLVDFWSIGNAFVGGLGKWLGDWMGLVNAIASFAVVWLILFWMYRKKTFIKI